MERISVVTPNRNNKIVIAESELQAYLAQDFMLLEDWTRQEEAKARAAWLSDPATIPERLEMLRLARKMRLTEYDEAISQLERQARLGFDVSQQIATWDAYAQALCALPDQPGAPWDGGGELTPWPVMPTMPK